MMNSYYPKYNKKDSYQTRYYKSNGNYYQRKNNRFKKNNNNNNNNYCWYYKNYKRIDYENIFEEEYNYEKETNENSFSKSTNSNSRRNSFGENSCEINEMNKDNNDKDINNQQKSDIVQKLNLSENVFKTAYFVPKSFKENKNIKENKENENKNEKVEKKDENIAILSINIKISKDKIISFQLRKYDDIFEEIKNVCEENNIDEQINRYLPRVIMRALNTIYGIMNLKLSNDEIELLNDIQDNYL
jgi:hypothetical protein